MSNTIERKNTGKFDALMFLAQRETLINASGIFDDLLYNMSTLAESVGAENGVVVIDTSEKFFDVMEKLEAIIKGVRLSTPSSLIDMAKVTQFGATKYSAGGAYSKVSTSQFTQKDVVNMLQSLGRHVVKRVSGELLDDETGISHEGAILWNASNLLTMLQKDVLEEVRMKTSEDINITVKLDKDDSDSK